MCVIVHQPSDAYLSKATAQQMWERNSDGGGFAYIDDNGKIQTGHAMTFKSFWKLFETARSGNRDKDFMVHFRIATSGRIGLPNTHPFQVDEHTWMAHNGILNHITGAISITAEYSDTREFIYQVVQELPETWLDNHVLVDMMEDYIGGSKLMFMTTNPALKKNIYILNEHKGVNKHRMWWSNDNHVPRPAFKGWTSTPKKKEPFKTATGARIMDQRKPLDSADTTVSTAQPSKTAALYKLPLPNTTAEDACERPTQEEVEAFWLGTEENYYAKNKVLQLRRDLGLGLDIDWDPVMEEWECQRCFTYVGQTGDCICWDLICVGCGAMAPYCVHDPEDAEFVSLGEAAQHFAEKTDRKESIEA